MRSLFQKLEGQYYLYKYGSLDKHIWEGRRSWAAGAIQAPFFKRWWAVEKTQRIYTQEFVELIEQAKGTNFEGLFIGAGPSDT